MASRGTVRVSITGDNRDLTRATRDSENKLDRLGRSGGRALRGLGTAAKYGGLALGVGLVAGAKKATDAAIEAEKAEARLSAQLKAIGQDTPKIRAEIDKVVASQSLMSGFDDEDLADSFTNIVRVTEDSSEALRLNNIAMDLARGKQLDVAKAGEIIGKVAGGNIGVLGRYGIKVKEGATAQEALATIQQKFAGQAKEYGNTTAGANERAKVAMENLAESAGRTLTPAIATAANGVATFVNQLHSGEGVGGSFRRTVEDIARVVGVMGSAVGAGFNAARNAVAAAVGAMTGFVQRNRSEFQAFGSAVSNIAKAIGWAFRTFMVPAFEFVYSVVKRIFPAIKQVVGGSLKALSGLVKVFSGLFTGDFGRMWSGVKAIFSGGAKAIFGVVRGLTAPLREGAARAGQAIASVFRGAWNTVRGVFSSYTKVVVSVVKGVTSPMRSVAGAVGGAVVSGFNKAKDIVGTIRGAISSVLGVIRDAPGRAASAMRNVASAIVGAFRGIGEKLLSPVRSALNAVIGVINAFINKFNNLFRARKIKGPGPLPDINFPGISLPTIPRARLGAGGAFTAPPGSFGRIGAAKVGGTVTGRGTVSGFPAGGSYAQQHAQGQVAVSTARETKGTEDDIAALKKLRSLVSARIKTLRNKSIPDAIKQMRTKARNSSKAAKKKAATARAKGKENLLRYTEELSQLLDEKQGLTEAIADLGAPLPADTDTGSIPVDDPASTPEPVDTSPAPTTETPADTGPTQDEQARFDQLANQLATSNRARDINAAAVRAFGSSGDIGTGRFRNAYDASVNVTINTLVPTNPSTLKAVADTVTSAVGQGQGFVSAPRVTTA